MIHIRNLILKYKGAKAPTLKGIDLCIQPGCITLLLGKSGCGKTSLLRCLGGLLMDYKGSIEIDGKPLEGLHGSARASLLGFVAQDLHLFPHLSILDNCVHPQQKVLKRNRGAATQIARDLLSQFGLSGLEDRLPSELSGGQQQRVAIVRTLAMDAQILLLDEPSSALDPENRKRFQTLLQDLQQRGLTIILSTHDLTFLEGVADQLYYLEEGQVIESVDLRKRKVNNEQILKLYTNISEQHEE